MWSEIARAYPVTMKLAAVAIFFEITIGIGAGPRCDGQVLVMHDLLGLSDGPPPRFVRRYVDLGEIVARAARMYAEDVREQKFPADAESYACS